MTTRPNHRSSLRSLATGMAVAGWLSVSAAHASQAFPAAEASRAQVGADAASSRSAPVLRAGSAAADFVPQAAVAAPAGTSRRAAECAKCRRATGSGDIAVFWLLFGGVAKADGPAADTLAAPEVAVSAGR